MKSSLFTMLGALSVAVAMVGCDSTPPAPTSTFEAKDDVANEAPLEEHSHGGNGGHIVELGDYHAEVVVAADRKISVYILGADEVTATPLAAATLKMDITVGEETKSVDATAAPLEGEADGQTSRFEIAADQVPESVHDIEELVGKITVSTGDKTMTGEIGHGHDADHGHDHDHDHEEAAPAPAPAGGVTGEAEHEHSHEETK